MGMKLVKLREKLCQKLTAISNLLHIKIYIKIINR